MEPQTSEAPADARASATPAISHRAGDAPDAGGEPGFWSVVLESLRGSRRDLTKTPLSRAILLLAVPMVLEMMGESVFAVADIFWVGELPLAYILARPLGMGPKGAFIAIAAAFSAIAVVSVTIFRRGRWKTVRV